MHLLSKICCLCGLAFPLQALAQTINDQSFYIGLGGQYQSYSLTTLGTEKLLPQNLKPGSIGISRFIGKRFHQFGLELGRTGLSRAISINNQYQTTHSYLAASYYLPIFHQVETFLTVGSGWMSSTKSGDLGQNFLNLINTSQISTLLGGGLNFALGSHINARVFAFHQFKGNQYISKKTAVNIGFFYSF